jgi:hypothetical protein
MSYTYNQQLASHHLYNNLILVRLCTTGVGDVPPNKYCATARDVSTVPALSSDFEQWNNNENSSMLNSSYGQDWSQSTHSVRSNQCIGPSRRRTLAFELNTNSRVRKCFELLLFVVCWKVLRDELFTQKFVWRSSCDFKHARKSHHELISSKREIAVWKQSTRTSMFSRFVFALCDVV